MIRCFYHKAETVSFLLYKHLLILQSGVKSYKFIKCISDFSVMLENAGNFYYKEIKQTIYFLKGGVISPLHSSYIMSYIYVFNFFYNLTQQPPIGPRRPHYRGFMFTLRHTTVGRTPMDEWSARRRDLYLTAQNSHKKQTSMPPVGFKPAIPASERPQTDALDVAATGTGTSSISYHKYFRRKF
jgi:hypothetical protein